MQQAAVKMFNAQKLQEEALAACRQLPKFARNPERWQGYLKLLGRELPWEKSWAPEWEELRASGFRKEMQLRKYFSGDLWYKALLPAIAAGSSRGWKVAETTEDDVTYAINLKFTHGLEKIRAGEAHDDLLKGGRNILGEAHVQVASCINSDELVPLVQLL